jgi:hypothetical protein
VAALERKEYPMTKPSTGKERRSGTSASANAAADEFKPEALPDIYASVCKGDHLEPVFKDGSCLVFSKTEPAKPDDFVGIWLRPDASRRASIPGVSSVSFMR